MKQLIQAVNRHYTLASSTKLLINRQSVAAASVFNRVAGFSTNNNSNDNNNKQPPNDIIIIQSYLTKAGISSKIDDSGQTIGKRYARTDECGIPFAITVDFDTLTQESVTLRDLHTMKQVRMPIADLATNISQLSNGLKTWDEVITQYPLFQSGAAASE